ncbi:AAA family ATPase, partial [Salmonella sp. SAL4458]|uniref:AAA family ATPase n=1 Tax=Salmonella sp. SAL4458 TaxID=3159913 RepID=UPI00397C50B9
QALVIMGVAGCGKSSVSQALCQRSGAHGIEGDSFHTAANIRKMSAGSPLTDDDRAGWLDTLAEQLRQAVAAGKLPVLT